MTKSAWREFQRNCLVNLPTRSARTAQVLFGSEPNADYSDMKVAKFRSSPTRMAWQQGTSSRSLRIARERCGLEREPGLHGGLTANSRPGRSARVCPATLF